MNTFQNENDNLEKSMSIAKKLKEKITNRKNNKENNKEIKTSLLEKKKFYFNFNYQLITVFLGYIVNTFLYFLYISTFTKIFDIFIQIISKITHYNHQTCLFTESIKVFIILLIWYNHLSAGYDGDPCLHLYKTDLKLINKREAIIACTSNILGTLLYLGITNVIFANSISNGINGNIIIEVIKKNKIKKENSFLTSFLYPKIPEFFKKYIMNLLIYSFPYNKRSIKYGDKIFLNNMELYSSIIMDTFLNEFICSFLNYSLLYIYLFTKYNFAYPLQINLIFTQIISLFSGRYDHLIVGPYMSLNWIINDCIIKKYSIFFGVFLIIFHYLGYKLASFIFKIPKLPIQYAKEYYKNIKPDQLQKYIKPDNTVDISAISDQDITDTNIVNSYLGKIFKFLIASYSNKIHNKKNA
ncbi:conserved Plasmodium protein, unknown function [Plasmodium berghei]|uniref:Uncharacterized protein n=2 Tax=Plasmodium berghei TaxID=5821 RepID=A0A509ANB7_PLABA|nr:conserved Plasmodium protein, unknown function [Plasmodium berghei ANKA]CXI78143.1 conserved Plasmodium protein, unknown function [Plasmodium berghei]SCM25144.1 conserved Plasmodium protein, unknown function [Plasmodium berghei]SCN27276.1 conserved Plasmodium protein, unknown function [Plasmodium berghei]SCO61882.1 conserved Plasmodium protein, unknown function [Plasmodium berghei]SCO63702.1 conserved Plasmodium protein, unknown function [Plasmodium berghei]|eukprot:XP_034422912.1 conserved Plasmodium protein, unknown function [Plasmodium berghei ANKA]